MFQSYLLISSDTAKARAYLQDFVSKQKISVFDTVVFQEEKTLRIEKVRELQKTLILMPVKSDWKLVAMFFKDATIEAQNALLKMLEEPPEKTFIFLVPEAAEMLLATIWSRCQCIVLPADPGQTGTDFETTKQLIGRLEHAAIGSKLFYAQQFGKSKAEALALLTAMLLVYREMFLHRTENQHVFLEKYKLLQNSYTRLATTNLSPRMSLEVLFLSLS